MFSFCFHVPTIHDFVTFSTDKIYARFYADFAEECEDG